MHGDVNMNKYWIYIYLCIYTCINTHNTMVLCIFTPVPLHCCTKIQICSTSHQSNEKTSSACPKMFDLECSWHLRGLVFFRFSTFCLPIYPVPVSIYPPRIYLSIFPYTTIYLSTGSPSDSISLYICGSLCSISSLSLSLSLSLSRSLALSLSLSLSLQNLATCTTCRSQFCTSQTAASPAHFN